MRKIGDRVTIRNGAGRWPGTVEAVLDGCWGPRYRVRIPPATVVECGERYLAPAEGQAAPASGQAPAPQEAPNT